MRYTYLVEDLGAAVAELLDTPPEAPAPPEYVVELLAERCFLETGICFCVCVCVFPLLAKCDASF